MRFHPDIIFTDYPAYPNVYGHIYSVLKLGRVPLIIRLLGDFWREHFPILSSENLFIRSTFLGNYLLWTVGFKFAKCIIPACHWLDGQVKLRLRSALTQVVHQGVDPAPWLKEETESFEFKAPAVGIIQNANILPKALGLIQFLPVARAMEDINFYIAGNGRYKPMIQQAYRGLSNVHFIGRIPYPHGVRKFHISCDLYAHPSGLDCCPATILEASLCRKPIVASRVGGIPELILEGDTGWTIPSGERDAWIEKIRFLLKDKSLTEQMGKKGRKFVTENFTWEIVSKKIAKIVRNLL